MTRPHVHAAPLPVPGIEEAMAALRGEGLRLSASRRLVLEALFAAEGPVSAEEIARGGEGRATTSDLASVYRNLETLEELGLVAHVHLGHGPGLYALARDESVEYLVCESCGWVRRVEASALEDLRAEMRERFGLEPRFSHFPMLGLCTECRSAAPTEPDA